MSLVETGSSTKIENLKLALFLGVLAALATLPLWAYVVMSTPKLNGKITFPLWLASCVQSGVLCGLLAWCGLQLGQPYGLDAPWFRALVAGDRRWPSQPIRWLLALIVGAMAGALVVLLLPRNLESILVFKGYTPAEQAWRGVLAVPYGGFVEEILVRLFLVSLIVWVIVRLNARRASTWVFVLAVVLAAVLFGVAHLPTLAAMGLASGWVAMAWTVFLNSIVGLASGYMFWRHGLEHAMLCHLAADLVLHVTVPFVL